MKVTATIWVDFETSAEEPVSKNVGWDEVWNALDAQVDANSTIEFSVEPVEELKNG